MRKIPGLIAIIALCGLAACSSDDDSGTDSNAGKKASVGEAQDGGGGKQASGGASGESGSSGDAGKTSTPDKTNQQGRAGHAGGGTSGTGGSAASDPDAGAPVDPESTSTPLAALPAAIAGAICEAMHACVGESALRELTNHEECIARIEGELAATEFAYMDMAIAAGRVLYDPSKLPLCLDGIQALGCDVLSHSLPDDCVDVLEGNVALDGECVISAECRGTAFCAGGDACPNHCAELLAEGDACTGDNQCGDSLTCVSGHCLRPSLEGEQCNGNSGKVCRLGFNCAGATDTEVGDCVPNDSIQVGDEGDVCEPGGLLCKEGMSCVYDGNNAFHCEAGVASGSACHLGLPSQCPNDEYCDATEVTDSSVCRKRPADGSPCALTSVCAPGLTCIVENDVATCREIAPNCGACTGDAACRSGRCVSGRCAPPPACVSASSCD